MTDETLTTVLLLSHERGHTSQSRVTESTCPKRISGSRWSRAQCPSVCCQSTSLERDRHMGVEMSKCGFSSLNLFSALTWSARCPRSHHKRRSIATPALSPNAPARCRLVDEYASSSATASAPSASASRLSSGVLSSTIDPGSGCAPPHPHPHPHQHFMFSIFPFFRRFSQFLRSKPDFISFHTVLLDLSQKT